MTLTSRSMEWLNQNRNRSYPMKRDKWRDKVPAGHGLDAVVLDAMLMDPDASGDEELTLESVDVSASETVVSMRYGDLLFELPPLSGGETSGEGSYELVRGSIKGTGDRAASLSLSLSSHAYILSVLGAGRWELGCPILDSRSIRISDGYGVDGISVNGSEGVEGHDLNASGGGASSMVSGDVVLEDGYRTSPIAYAGKVMVRVGRRYGYDPCKHDFGDDGSVDCRKPLFFFCGQNAVNSGNIVIKGGSGISVTQGGTYLVRDEKSKCDGMRIPCIEITAGRSLLDMCKPQVD